MSLTWNLIKRHKKIIYFSSLRYSTRLIKKPPDLIEKLSIDEKHVQTSNKNKQSPFSSFSLQLERKQFFIKKINGNCLNLKKNGNFENLTKLL